MNKLPLGIAPVRPSVRYMLIRTSPWLISFFFLIIGTFLINPLLLILCWLTLLAFFYHVFLLCSEVYVITPDMFMVCKGLLNKTVSWLEHLQIKDYQIRQSRLMGYLNIVTISFVSKDDQNLKFTLKGVDNVAMRNAYKDIIELLEQRKEYYKKLIDLAEKLTANQ